MSMVRRASICSEIRMMPISAVMEDPARAMTMMAVSTGPISRTRESATAEPRAAVEPYFTRA